MKKIKIIGWITVGFLLLLQTGCGGTASSVTQTTEEPLAEIEDITTADTTAPPGTGFDATGYGNKSYRIRGRG